MIKIIIKVTKNQINHTKDQLKAAIKTVLNKVIYLYIAISH